jgi:hypothetical protein
MQPYFFPYLGYFDLINRVDKWIVFDTAQYIRHGWVNRNRILHPNHGWLYIIVPVTKHRREAAIKDIEIANQENWKRRILGQLSHYKNRAPYAYETIAFVKESLASEEGSLSRLNVSILDRVCARLGIGFDYRFFSRMNLDLGPIEGPGDWALRISEALGAEEYVNLPGGADLFDGRAFAGSGIKLTIRNPLTLKYACGDYDFIPNLSIIDVLMWNEPEEVKACLDEHKEEPRFGNPALGI